VTKNCPNRIGEMLLARKGGWRAPTLLGVVHTPQFRRDGSLAMTQGYDLGTRLLFKPDGETFPTVPDSPTKNDAIAAVETLEAAIKTFPFKTDVDRSVALSLFLTAFCRRTLDHAPMHGISSPAAGTGKSLLVDLGSILTSGQDAPVISPGRNEEELEKRLGASLLRGDALISLDNCTAPLGGTLLCQALTQRRLHIRVLGASRHIEVPTSALFTATGNNLIFEGDITRRVLLCMLDAEVERPELRTFETDIKTIFRERRGELVSAGLTILRARHLARPQPTFAPLGGFEMWSRWVRDALRWLDRADPCRSMDPLREKDPSRIAHETVVLAWRDAFGIGTEVRAQQLLERANLSQELRSALLEVAEERTRSGFISPKRLGRWLAKVEGEISNGLRCSRSAGQRHPRMATSVLGSGWVCWLLGPSFTYRIVTVKLS
jgi:putative DNA primase/helicase